MAQFVVTWWCILLYVFCSTTTLSVAKGVVTEQATTIVPSAIDNGSVNKVNENGQQHLISGDERVDVGVGASENAVGGGQVTAPEVDSAVKKQRVYHPVAVSKPRVIEQYDHRSLDGQYEYRYLLTNGEARYERAYWQPAGKNMVLARKGYYSHQMENQKFLTVFYTADQNGYREDSSIYSRAQPNLPRSMEIPEYVPPSTTNAPITQRPTSSHVYTSTTTRRPYVHATGNPFLQFYSTTTTPQTATPQSLHHNHNHHQHQAQVQSSTVSSTTQNSAGGHASSLTGHHPSNGIQSSSGVPSSWGVHQIAGTYPSTTYPSVPHQSWHSSGVYALSGTQSPLEVHSSAAVQSSAAAHSQSEAHISHSSSFGTHPSYHAHQSIAVQTSPSQQHHSIGLVSAGQSTSSSNSASNVSPPVPVESYNYNF